MGYSETDLRQMKAAFSKVFGVTKEQCDCPEVINWMSIASTGCVDYDGFLTGETPQERDFRMEQFQAYESNDVEELVNSLKRTLPECRPLTKWEAIFKVYSGIEDVNSVIRSAKNWKYSQQGTVKTDAPHVDEPQSKLSSSNEERSVEPVKPVEALPPKENPVERQEQRVTNSDASGKDEGKNEQPLYNKETINSNVSKEDYSMNADDLMRAANTAGGSTTVTNTQQTGGTKVAAKPAPTLSDDYINAARQLYYDSLEERAAWTSQHFVSRVISPYEPTARRIIDANNGFVSADESKSDKVVARYVQKFEQVVGRPLSDMEALPLSERYPNVRDDANRERAEATRQLLLELKQNPTKKIKVYVDPDPAITIKGYTIDGQNLDAVEMRDLMMAKSSGAIYAVGALVDGKPSNEGTKFVLSTVTRVQSSGNAKAGSKPTTDAQVEKVKGYDGVIRPSNKKNFIDKAGNVAFVYPIFENATAEQRKNTRVKAAIMVGSKEVPATFRAVDVDENGNVKMTEGKPTIGKDGQTVIKGQKEKTVAFSLSVMTPTAVTKVAPNDEFTDTAAKFVKRTLGDGKGTRNAVDFTSADAIREALKPDQNGKTPISQMEKLIAASAMGATLTTSANADVVAIVNAAKSAAGNKAAAQNAADSDDLLG